MLQVVILSLIQSLTEFLPVSSTAHLILIRLLFKWPDSGLLMDLGLHLGTLCAVVVYFFKDLVYIVTGVYKKGLPRHLLFCVSIAFLPILLFGFLLEILASHLFRQPVVIAVSLIVFGILLYLADRFGKNCKNMGCMTIKDAAYIGCAQCLAVIPGASRSGVTMTMARFLGINRSDAAQFSMILSVPTILVAAAYAVLKVALSQEWQGLPFSFYWGIALSFWGGLFAICFLMNWVKKHSFMPFMVYRIALGIILLVILYIS